MARDDKLTMQGLMHDIAQTPVFSNRKIKKIRKFLEEDQPKAKPKDLIEMMLYTPEYFEECTKMNRAFEEIGRNVRAALPVKGKRRLWG